MFRRALLVLTALTIALPAAAQTRRVRAKGSLSANSYDSELQERRRRVMSPYLMNGFGVGLAVLNTTTKQDVGGEIDATPIGQGKSSGKLFDDTNTSTAPGLFLGYSMIQRMGVGFTADLTYSQMEKIADMKIGFLRPAVNIAFGGASNFYGFAGANWMSFTGMPEFTGGALKGKTLELRTSLGGQVGAGYVNSGIEGRLQYSYSRATVAENFVVSDPAFFGSNAELPVKFDGTYDFSGIELTLLYRF